MKGTGAKRNVCPGSCVSTGATFPVARVESAPMHENMLRLAPGRQPRKHLIARVLRACCFSWRPTNSFKAVKAKIARKCKYLEFARIDQVLFWTWH